MKAKVPAPFECPFCGHIYRPGLYDYVFHPSECEKRPWITLEDIITGKAHVKF